MRPVCAGVGLALQVVHSSPDGVSAVVAVRPGVRFDVSGKYEEEGDDCRKGVPLKRKYGIGSFSPGPVRSAESVGCVPERLHLFPREEGCRGRHGEAVIVTLLLLLLLRRAPRALEGDPSERQHLLGVGREDSEWGRMTTKGVLLEDIEVWASVQPVF